MTDHTIWEALGDVGGTQRGWWFALGAPAALLLALVAYILVWRTLRQNAGLHALFGWLLLASVPILLLVPSAYVAVAPRAALARAGLEVEPQQIGRALAAGIGVQLGQLARLGQLGAALSLATVGGSYLTRRSVEGARQRAPRAMTRRFRVDVPRERRSSHGMVLVARGQHQGARYAIGDGAVLGTTGAAIPLADTIVSRRHARFELGADGLRVVDLGSTNGTFVRRAGKLIAVREGGTALAPDDRLWLGHPDEPAAVELVLEALP